MNDRFEYDPLMFTPDNKYVASQYVPKDLYDHDSKFRERIRSEVLRKVFYSVADQSLHKNGVNIKVEVEVFDLYTSLQNPYCIQQPVLYEFGNPSVREVLVAAKCYVSHPRDIQYEVKEVDWHTYPSYKLRDLVVQLVKTNVKSVVRKVKNQLREWERDPASLWPTKP